MITKPTGESSSPDYQEIYRRHAGLYDRLVSREDYQGNLLRALRQIRPLDGLEVVEVGAGTGRITRLLAPAVQRILALDISPAMLGVAITKLRQQRAENWQVAVADNCRLPVRDGVADLAVAGWTFGHTTTWSSETWYDEIAQAIQELRRVLQPDGVAVIVETLGTGQETPSPPNEALTAYYAWLEREQGFHATWTRTDFRFESPAEADELTRFFFGAVPEARSIDKDGVIIPECTGVWWRAG